MQPINLAKNMKSGGQDVNSFCFRNMERTPDFLIFIVCPCWIKVENDYCASSR